MINPRSKDPEANSRSRVVKVDVFSSKGIEMDRTYDQIRLYDVPIQKEIHSDDGRWLIQTEIGGDRGASSRLPFCCMQKIRHSELIRPSSGTKLLLRGGFG